MSSSASGTSANANAPTLDINEFLDIAEFNRGLATIFNMDLFNTPVNETSDEIHYNTFVLARIVDYKVSSTCQGLELLGSFQEDFEDWEEDDFKKVDPRVLQVPNEDLDPAIANQFSKLWDRKLNYSGDAYDILDDKIRYFLDACLTASIKPSQFHALLSNILTKRAKNFFVHQVSRDSTFAEMYQKMKQHFDTEVNRQQYHTDWTSINFTQLRKESPEKPLCEILQALLDKLQLCQRALGNSYGGEDQLISTTIRACRGVPELEFALFVPAKTFEGLSSQLRSSLTTVSQRQPGQPSQYLQDQDQFFTDRRYQHPADKRKKWTKRCYVCGKEGCFSTKHPDDERKRAKERYLRERGFHGQKSSSRPFTTFLADYEGDPDEDQTSDSADDDSDDQSDSFFAAAFLSNRAFRHRIHTVEGESICEESQHFLLDRYNRTSFQGILPDTGAAKISTAGIDQFRALQREMPTVQLRKNATIATVRFGGNEPTNTIGITTVITPIGEVVFHVINMSTPFLLCLKDMDRLGAYLNNVTNELICGDKRIPIIKADAPRRFKFTLKDNCDFNYELIVDSLLQMAFKSVNDTAGPDGLVPTLLVFEVTVELDNGPAKFRSTAVQPYFRHPDSQQQRSHDVLQQPHADNQTADNQADSINVETEVPKPFEYPEPERPRRRGRPRKPFSLPRSQFSPANMFLSHKECAALDLAVKLRAEKKITTAGRPFEASDDLEITNLLGAGVIVPERYDMNKHGKHRLFKSRMVREVKGKNTATPYEKSRLVVQGYGDDEKQINVTTAETNADTALQVNAFGVAALQTDDTLLVGTTTFLQREDRELCFQAKPKKTLREGDTCDFNGSLIALEKGYLLVMQKGLEAAKVFVFTDGSFANNKDLSSQIGFVIIIATETKSDESFTIHGNLIHWSSTKCKRVTRSVLASEIYGLASGFDLAYVITETINQITNRLGLPQIPLVVCTDSYSLYECLVKLGTTTEKRLMIDIMALRQAYEQRDITSIRWINGADNPADAMTKLSPNGALTRFVNDNEITIRLEGWVQRKEDMTIEEAIND
ncbi:hypothetical protein HRG_007600 [Hirsutella rhossiliensis]